MQNQTFGAPADYQLLQEQQKIMKYRQRINGARGTLIIIGILTLVNAVLDLLNLTWNFVAGCYTPLFLSYILADTESAWTLIYLISSAFLGVLFLLFGILFKKHTRGCTLFATVLYSIDMVLLIIMCMLMIRQNVPFTTFLLDIVIHAVLLVSLIMAAASFPKLQEAELAAAYWQQQAALNRAVPAEPAPADAFPPAEPRQYETPAQSEDPEES